MIVSAWQFGQRINVQSLRQMATDFAFLTVFMQYLYHNSTRICPEREDVFSSYNLSVVIHQGEVYWVQPEDIPGAGSGYAHPCVVIQEDVINQSRLNTVVVCALTSNLKRAKAPGNVLLEAGEANLPRQSVVEISKISTVDKRQLGELIGSLSEQRVTQILAGMRFLQLSIERRGE